MPDPTPLQLMDRLLDALRKAGIGWCMCHYAIDEHNRTIDAKQELISLRTSKVCKVCMEGALVWAIPSAVLTSNEAQVLYEALLSASASASGEVSGVVCRNDQFGWDFARFREELAKMEVDDAR